MITRVTGTIVDGSLVLDQKLDLPDHSRVNVTLEPLAGEASSGKSEFERLENSFAKYSREAGPRTWKREDLYER